MTLSTATSFKAWVKEFALGSDGLLEKLISFGLSILLALIIFFVGRFIIRKFLKFIGKIFEKGKLEVSIQKFLLSLIRVSLYALLVIIICSVVGIQTTSFITVLGSAGLTIGLALQGSLSNFAGGVLILVSKPFKVGDYICDKGSNTEGFVLKIDLLYTNLRTYDNKMITIPNGTLADSTIVNYTALGNIRVSVKTDIAYGADIKKAKEVLLKAADKHEAVMKNRPVTVSVTELGSSGVKLELRVWAANLDDYWKILFDLTEDVKLSLDEAGIEIPFNQVTVHMAED